MRRKVASEREFQRAIALNQNYAIAHEWYGFCLGCMGQFDKAFAELKQAIQLDPLSLAINMAYAAILWLGRQWDRAIEQAQKTLELDPNFPARWALARAYDSKGMPEAAIGLCRRAWPRLRRCRESGRRTGSSEAVAGNFRRALRKRMVGG